MVMARESNIDRSDEWFVGERKTLAYTVYAPDSDVLVEDITGWTIEWRMHTRRVAVPILALPAVVVNGPAGLCDVEVLPEHYVMKAGTYVFGLWRTDVEAPGVLAYGTIVLRSIEESV